MEELGLGEVAKLIEERRTFHQIAEPAWCEVLTATKIVEAMAASGFDVRFGADVVNADARVGLPSASDLEYFHQQALSQGGNPEIAGKLRGGFTGVVGGIRGKADGPVIAFRFDVDANRGLEDESDGHRPNQIGFRSLNQGIHHNCGHDGHIAMGLALARTLASIQDELAGEIRLIFQPAEEGLRGGKAMIAAGVLEGVDFFVGSHLGVQALHTGEIISGYTDLLASVKIDASFHGKAAHAAISPHEGRNALLAACVSAQNLMAIPRHGLGDTRINIGNLSGGESRNTVPSFAEMSLELRADDDAALEFLKQSADRVLSSAAAMHEVAFESHTIGESRAASSDDELSRVVREVASNLKAVKHIRDRVRFKGSDDAAEMMRSVQERGGQAVYFGIGTELEAVHHNPKFDFNEAALAIGHNVLVGIARRLAKPSE